MTARTTSRENQLLGVPEASEESAQSAFIKPTKRPVQLPAPKLLISRAAPRTPSQAPRERSAGRTGASHNRRRKTLYGLAAVVLFAPPRLDRRSAPSLLGRRTSVAAAVAFVAPPAP